MPGSRRLLQPVFYFLVSYDDFFLYYYHLRSYGPNLDAFFASVRNTEKEKWQILNTTNILDKVGVNLINLENSINVKENYTAWKFTLIEGNSAEFF